MDTTIPENVLVWQFTGKPGNLSSQNRYSNDGYNMLCKTNNRILTYVEDSQPPGAIDLDFTTNAALRKTHFRLPDGTEREIRTGENVSLEIGGGDASLYYDERPLGINLKWSNAPRFEWRIFDLTGEKGKLIQTGQWVAILNLNVQPDADFMVYMDRAGANIGWTSSTSVTDKVVSWATEEARKVAMQLLTS